MYKALSLTIFLVFGFLISMAQMPEKFSYQAIVRDLTGAILPNQQVSLQVVIHDGSPTGTDLFHETHNVTSNSFGLVNLAIGEGTDQTGSLATVSWNTGSKYMEVLVDADGAAGGYNYTSMGATELLSVPYAMYAKTAESMNETDPLFGSSTASGIVAADTSRWNTAWTWGNHANAGYLLVEADGSPTNELQVISLSNDTLYLTNGGFVKLPAGFDGQYSSLTGSPTNLSDFNNDAGYISGYTETDTMLWKKNSGNIYFSPGNVGIGTNNPAASLDVSSNSSGLLIPRMTKAQRDLIASPQLGLMIWNTDCESVDAYTSSGWQSITTGGKIPAQAGPVTGASSVCFDLSEFGWTVSPVTGADSYNWIYTGSGVNILTGAGTNSITGTFSTSATEGFFVVNAVNDCGQGKDSYPFLVRQENRVVQANAGADQDVECSNSILLTGSDPGNGSGQWTITYGTGSINNPGSKSTYASFTGDSAIFRWTVTNPPCSPTFDEATCRFTCETDIPETVVKVHFNGNHGSTVFTDNSAITPHAITVFGNAKVDSLGKFCESGYFDGSGDYLSMDSDADFDLGSGDFTIECWFMIPNVTGYKTIFASNSDYTYGLFLWNNKMTYYASSTGFSWNLLLGDQPPYNGLGTTVITPNVWHHVAFVRNGDNWMGFIDGQLDMSQTVSGSVISKNEAKNIGRWGNNSYWFNGRIDEFRLIKGLAKYTAPFSPPAYPYCD